MAKKIMKSRGWELDVGFGGNFGYCLSPDDFMILLVLSVYS